MEKYIEKINELYITYRKKYLIMFPNGTYISAGLDSNSRIKKPLVDTDIVSHLNGEKTFGVFAGEHFSKFICFDIDVPNKEYAKWNAYKVVQALVEIGIPIEKIYPSLSGSKGYHVEVFFKDVIPNDKIVYFFDLVMEKAEYEKCEEYVYQCEGGKIELRPVGCNLGVKLPLGKHFNTKNKKRCWYVDVNTLEEIRKKTFIFEIKQVEKSLFDCILERDMDLTLEDLDHFHDTKTKVILEIKDIVNSNYRPLEVYSQNIDVTLTYDGIKKLEEQGLTQVGTRHNALFKLAKMYRFEGLTQEQCRTILIDWMKRQDKSKYTTSQKECIKDIEQIVDYIYKNDVGLTIYKREITIYEKEIEKIIILPKKCHKLISFALLVHSKRLAQANGVFYMTQKQMSMATGYSERTIRRELDVLEEYGVFNYVSRNQMLKNNKGQFIGKKPNKYKMNIIFNQDEELDVKSYTFNIQYYEQYNNRFNDSLLSMYSLTELRKMLTKRMYDEIREYRMAS